MGYTATPVNAVQIPNNQEFINQAYIHTQKVAQQTEPFTVMRFASMADLAAKLVGAALTPKPGMFAFVTADNSFYGYVSGAWHRVYPTEKSILTGTSAPASTLGAVGDIYFQV
jgi:hypothetical protein